MYEFDYWLENILSTARLIASPELLRRAWIGKDESVTSAYDVHELLEQLLGDLHINEDTQTFSDQLRERNALEAVTGFAETLSDLEVAIRADSSLLIPENLFESYPWGRVRQASAAMIEAFSPGDRKIALYK